MGSDMICGKLICMLRGKHRWRRQTKTERQADIATAARMAAIGGVKVTALFGKVCRRCGKIEAVKKRKPKCVPAGLSVS